VVVIQHRADAASFNGFLGSGVWFCHLVHPFECSIERMSCAIVLPMPL
jgi:hypothetical protein